MEKTRVARDERSGLRWPGLSTDYETFGGCFYILDTVRMSFICCGATLLEQVQCCMLLLEEFRACTAEKHGVCVLRQKSGFARLGEDEPPAAGGYADVKLLCYADLGYFLAFDGTRMPLRIVGEVQLILQDYCKVKERMHLAYEVDRGSFDRSSEGSRLHDVSIIF